MDDILDVNTLLPCCYAGMIYWPEFFHKLNVKIFALKLKRAATRILYKRKHDDS